MPVIRMWIVGLCLTGFVVGGAITPASASNHQTAPPSSRLSPRAFADTLARAQSLERDYPKQAESTGLALLERLRRTQDPDSIRYAEALMVIVEARLNQDVGFDPMTLAAGQRALSILEARVNPMDPRLGRCLQDVGNLFSMRGDARSARPFFERAVGIWERAPGPDSLELARGLDNVAGAMSDMGEFAAAKPVYQRSLRIWETARGSEGLEVATAARNLAIVDQELGDLQSAMGLYERALRIREAKLGPDHPDVARALNSIALVHVEWGDYAEAQALYERAIAIWEKAEGKESRNILAPLNNLATLLRRRGHFDLARTELERALAIGEKGFGPEHPFVAACLFNLGDVQLDLGDFPAAGALFRKCVAVAEKSMGPEHPQIALPLSRLGYVESQSRHFARAESLEIRALAIREKAFGPDHPGVATCLYELGSTRAEEGKDADAKRDLERAISILEKSISPDTPQLGQPLVRLGAVLRHTGDRAGAVARYERALAIYQRVGGGDYPDVGRNLAELSLVYADMGRDSAALDGALRAEQIGREHLRRTVKTLPEREALEYEGFRASGMDLALSVTSRTGRHRADPSAAVWDALIRSRALVLDEIAGRRQVRWASADSEVMRLGSQYATAAERLASLMVRGPESGSGGGAFRVAVDSLRAACERAERTLAARSVRFRVESLRAHAGLKEVTAALPPGAALVGFVRYHRHPGSTPGGGTPPPSVPSYLAFVSRGAGLPPVAVPLGPAARIDALAERWKRCADRPPAGRAAVRESDAAGVALRRAVWDPLTVHLAGASHVFIVPDGALALVNLYALPLSGSRYLVETGPLLSYLSTERDLLPAEKREAGEGLLALGGPDFDATTTLSGVEPAVEPEPGAAAFRGGRSPCGDFQRVRFHALPGSVREIEEVSSTWRGAGGRSVTELTGARATESAFKAFAPACGVLHLATHGFFLGSCGGDNARGIGAVAISPEADAAGPAGSNPLLLSGLALAGANNRGQAKFGEDDGIVTAEEVGSLDLSRVDLAVLSACDTGAGEVLAGEGVLGLRRAFEVAGARSLVTSLWSVDDASAQRWMRALYRARFVDHRSTSEAARDATRTALRERRAAHQSTHPYYWATFVAAGEWR